MTKKRPSGWMYVVGALVMVGGCGASVASAIWSAMSNVEEMQRVVIPGSHDLELEPKEYTIYWESRSMVDGTAYMNPGQATVRCGLSTPAGDEVSIRGAGASETYTVGSYQGESMFELDIDQPGSYRLTCELSGEGASQGVLAIGQGLGVGAMMLRVLGAFVAFGLGLFIILRTYMRRRPPPVAYGYAAPGPGYGRPGAPGHRPAGAPEHQPQGPQGPQGPAAQ